MGEQEGLLCTGMFTTNWDRCAYTSELDAWWRDRAKKIEREEERTQAPSGAAGPEPLMEGETALAGSPAGVRQLTGRLGSRSFALLALAVRRSTLVS